MGLSTSPPRFVSSIPPPLRLPSAATATAPPHSSTLFPQAMDTTTAGIGNGVEEEDQARMDAISEKLQTRDAMRLYAWLSERCFSDCVTTFYRKALGKREGDCVRACVHKYRHFTAASSARFAELADPSTASSSDED